MSRVSRAGARAAAESGFAEMVGIEAGVAAVERVRAVHRIGAVELAAIPRARPAGRTMMLRAAGGLCMGAVLVVAFLRLVNVSAVYSRLAHLRIAAALLCGVAFLGAYFVRAMRWRCLLRPCRVSVGRAAGIYQVATFLNWMLPVRGGELAKSLLLRRLNQIPVSQSLATVSMDKAIDLLPALALLALLPFVHLHLSRALWLLLLFALTIVATGAVVLALAAWRRERALALLTRPLAVLGRRDLRDRVEPLVGRFLDTLVALVRQPRLMLVAVAYTALAVSLDALFCLLAFRAVGVDVTPTTVLYGYTFFNLAFILPTPPGQIGSNELVGLMIFSGGFGLGRSGVAAMFLFSHPWTALLMTTSGLLCLSAMGLSLRGSLRLAGDHPEGEPE
jgi:uncharacterized protein (TIRG00374 family)